MDNRTTDLARFLVREQDTAIAAAERTRNMPHMHAEAEGRLTGIRNALAYVAGQEGYREVDRFIHAVRREMPHPQLVMAEPAGARPVAEADRNGIPDQLPPTIQRAMDGDR